MNAIDKWAQRWPHFGPNEVLSPDQLNLFMSQSVIPYSFRALDKLESFRTFVNAPIIVNKTGAHLRGARSVKEVYTTNQQTRGDDKAWGYSFHLWCAFDINIGGCTPKEVFRLAVESALWRGIGVYDTFTHVDDRDTLDAVAVTWDYRTKK